jgi:hypothetical protein
MATSDGARAQRSDETTGYEKRDASLLGTSRPGLYVPPLCRHYTHLSRRVKSDFRFFQLSDQDTR